MTNISVFGSSGFIGSAFCESFSENTIKIDRESNIPKSQDILYFISTVDNYNIYTDPYVDVETNLIKLISVLEETKKLENATFNFISSWFVYGKCDTLPAREDDPCNPSGFYSITKHAAERLLISYCETFGIKYRILRLTNIIGPSDRKVSNKKNALQYMLNLLRTNETVCLYDNGTPIRDYMHVTDCVRAIDLVLRSELINTVINISNNEPKSIGDIISYAKQKLGSTSNIEGITTPNFHLTVQTKDMYLDNTKLRMLGYVPYMSVYDAVDDILKNG
jgi:nucleoside-diphosphate-sugar epimerase